MRFKKWLSIFYAILIYSFFYLPILILFIYSFNQSRLNAIWTGFTFDWYKELINNTAVIEATKNSLIIAVTSSSIATILGAIVAIGMSRYHFRGKVTLDGMFYLPLVIPVIVMGISFLAYYDLIGIPFGMLSVIIAHVTFSIPYVYIIVRARLDGFDMSLEEAAKDLGASEWQTFIRVTIPLIFPGIFAGALLAFTVSIDDVVISFFVAGPGSTTLPLQIFSMIRFGITPEINALSVLMIVISISIALTAERIRLKKQN